MPERERLSLWPIAVGCAASVLPVTAALAQAPGEGTREFVHAIAEMRYQGLFGLALFVGLVVFAMTTAILHMKLRGAWVRRDREAQAEIQALVSRADRAETLLNSEPQIVAVWSAPAEAPAVTGELPGIPPGARLFQEAWLEPQDAVLLKNHLSALQSRGEAFRIVGHTRAGTYVEADGRAIGGRAVLRLREVTGDRLELARFKEQHRQIASEMRAIRALLDRAPTQVWLRDAQDRLSFVNAAYASAVDAASDEDAVSRGIELLDRAVRDEASVTRGSGKTYARRVPAVVNGARRILDVIEIPSPQGAAGMAIDVSEVESAKADHERHIKAHARTLDQLATAVATYDADQRLSFYNAAFQALWQLEPRFLEEKPTDGEILDRLRALRRLPEQADFRDWKAKLHEAYRSLEAAEHWWHLPGGKTLRVVTTPNPAGGVTYVFEDVTERIDLEARYKAMASVQGETLENLKEGVTAFGTDGRLRLHNPAFARLWNLSQDKLDQRPHIDDVVGACLPLFREGDIWRGLKSAVTSLADQRQPARHRMHRVDGSYIDVATVPLPDGGTLITFTDVTDTVNFETALVEKNEALEEAARVKNDFVHHVSYELRSPLTNIIGFVQLLADGAAGPLSAKQRQYAGYIMTSSDALLAIINNILDLATIDAGAMTLDVGTVDVREAMQGAAEAVQPRLAETGVRLEMKAGANAGTFEADGKRVRQVLFNLLSNGIGFSESGDLVSLSAERIGEEIVFRVEDHGRGIPQAVIDRVFDRFESHAGGTSHRGVGLGLSIVRSFVELHGGTVELVSEDGRGTVVSCRFPVVADKAHREAAE